MSLCMSSHIMLHMSVCMSVMHIIHIGHEYHDASASTGEIGEKQLLNRCLQMQEGWESYSCTAKNAKYCPATATKPAGEWWEDKYVTNAPPLSTHSCISHMCTATRYTQSLKCCPKLCGMCGAAGAGAAPGAPAVRICMRTRAQMCMYAFVHTGGSWRSNYGSSCGASLPASASLPTSGGNNCSGRIANQGPST